MTDIDLDGLHFTNDENLLEGLVGKTYGSSNLNNGIKEYKYKEKENDSESTNIEDYKKSKPTHKVYVQKHSEENLLAETVIVAGKPYFAVAKSNPENATQITLEESITTLDGDVQLRPYDLTLHMNKPYVFKSKQEFEAFVEKSESETLDTLYRKVKSIWKKYIDADDFHISICAADSIFTYYQDKIGLTHYLFFVGNNASGKSNNLTVFHFLAYRNMTSTDITSANIYQFLGSREEGQGSICEDEADNIDEDRQKMKIYKDGYTTGRPVTRTDISDGRKQQKFYTFCFKAFAAERLPDSLKGKGFNQRTIELPCTYGFPQYDILEVSNPAGDEEFQYLLDELNEIRNSLLVYRLLHHKDKIPNINLNIQNREKQLFKPLLRVFQNADTLKELLPVISKYVSQNREKNANTLHAFLYRTIVELIRTQHATELDSTLIWRTITDLLPGEDIPNKKLSYESSEFGTISQKEITQILKDVFGAKPPKRHGNSNRLIFDIAKLKRLGKIYDLSVEVKVVASDTKIEHEKFGEGGIDGMDVGLDKHLQVAVLDTKEEEIVEGELVLGSDQNNPSENIQAASTSNENLSSIQLSQRPHPSQTDMNPNVYRKYADTWGCHNCTRTGDKWFMQNHFCRA